MRFYRFFFSFHKLKCNRTFKEKKKKKNKLIKDYKIYGCILLIFLRDEITVYKKGTYFFGITYEKSKFLFVFYILSINSTFRYGCGR